MSAAATQHPAGGSDHAECRDGDCGRCDACVDRVLRRASARLSAAYGQPVDLTLDRKGHVSASPTALPRRRSPRRPPAIDDRLARVQALLTADDPAARIELERQHADEALRALADELATLARARGAEVRRGRGPAWRRVHIELPSGIPLRVRLGAAVYHVGPRRQTVSGSEALRAAVAAEVALDGRLTHSSSSHALLERLLAGELRGLSPWHRGLADRLGLLDDAAPAAWLREQLASAVEHGLTPGGLGSPVSTTGVIYGSGRLLALDGIPICHVDAEALATWRIWAAQRAGSRRHAVTGHALAVSWQPITWGSPGDPGACLPFARDGPEPADVVFARHRRMYARQALPPVDGVRTPTDWGRAGTPIPLDPPPRSRGPARSLYVPLARHWLVGWSLAELAAASGVSRSAVDRLIRWATRVSTEAREAFERRRTCAYAGRWLAVHDGRVVVTETWSGLDE